MQRSCEILKAASPEKIREEFLDLLRGVFFIINQNMFIEILQNAVNEECSCGGGGPDTGCQACMVWHRVEGYFKNFSKTADLQSLDKTMDNP